MNDLGGNNMKNEVLQVIGRECKVFELQLPCECGGYFAIKSATPSENESKYINGEFHVAHICNKCNRKIFITDIYPKNVSRPFGEFIRFGEQQVRGE